MKFLDKNGVLLPLGEDQGGLCHKDSATSTENGLMSSADKVKLDGIATGANKYVHPSYTPKESGLYKITVDAHRSCECRGTGGQGGHHWVGHPRVGYHPTRCLGATRTVWCPDVRQTR